MSEFDGRTASEIYAAAKSHSLKIKDLVPAYYHALLREPEFKGQPKEATLKVRKDFIALGWSKEYIIRLLPVEAKEEDKVKAGQASAVEKSQQKLTNNSCGTSTILETKASDSENSTSREEKARERPAEGVASNNVNVDVVTIELRRPDHDPATKFTVEEIERLIKPIAKQIRQLGRYRRNIKCPSCKCNISVDVRPGEWEVFSWRR